MEWFPTKYILPKTPGKYLCWEEHYSQSVNSATIGYFDGQGFETEIAEDYSNVTHWMPMPEPPTRPGQPPKP